MIVRIWKLSLQLTHFLFNGTNYSYLLVCGFLSLLVHGRQTQINTVCTFISARCHYVVTQVEDKLIIYLNFLKNPSRVEDIWILLDSLHQYVINSKIHVHHSQLLLQNFVNLINHGLPMWRSSLLPAFFLAVFSDN